MRRFSGHPSRQDFQPKLGSRAGDYVLDQVLATGPRSVVYVGVADDGSRVAIKLLRGRGHEQKVFEEKRQGLAQACKAPSGARVARLVRAWRDRDPALQGCYCLATAPYCSGGNLEAMIQNSPAPELATRLEWALEVAETLLLLHHTPNAPAIHGAVTPRNVALRPVERAFCPTAEGRLEAYLLESHRLSEPYENYSSSVALEMVQASRAFDQSADVWSWGVLLYALLSWSLKRMGGGADGAWLASLPRRKKAAWEHELVREPRAGINEEQWGDVVDLMVDCLRPREERVSMETLVDVMGLVLGYKRAPSSTVTDPWAQACPSSQAETISSLVQQAAEHKKVGRHAEEERCLGQALSIARVSDEGVRSSLLWRCLRQLALFHENKGEYAQARPLYEEALAILRKVRPPSKVDIDMAATLYNLAGVYEREQSFERARSYHEEALAIRRKALPNRHPDIGASLHSLALMHFHLCDAVRARLLYEDALALRMVALPANHLDIAATLDGLGMAHHVAGEFDKAKALYEKSIAIRRVALPPMHIDLAMGLSHLAAVHLEQHKYAQARPLYEEALAIRRATLPPGHVDIASALHPVAIVHYRLGEWSKVQLFYDEALAIRRAALPPTHPDILSVIDNLSGLHTMQREYEEAGPLLEEALAIRRATLPPGHDQIIGTLCDLALYRKTPGSQECQHVGRAYNALVDMRNVRKDLSSAEFVKCVIRLAVLHEDLSQPAQALRVYEEALAIGRATLPPGHAHVRKCMTKSADLLRDQGEYERAQRLYEEAVAVTRAALRLCHPDTATCLHSLARVHLLLEERDRAAALYEEALRMMMAIPPPGHPDMPLCRTELVSLLTLLKRTRVSAS